MQLHHLGHPPDHRIDIAVPRRLTLDIHLLGPDAQRALAHGLGALDDGGSVAVLHAVDLEDGRVGGDGADEPVQGGAPPGEQREQGQGEQERAHG